ncbi:hypothetical protein B0H21DRAFT_729492 [Amylocystis lapponica]|nr:hypothetical protein B0H21DRAFT_729492 [Amylocystis lapponica]
MQNLPLELHDEIIDYLCDDSLALATCALTYRTWLFCVRPHRFRTVKLRQPSDCTRFHELISAPLLKSHEIPYLVHDLTISSRPLDDNELAQDTEWLREDLPRVLARLDSVRRLWLENIEWGPETLPAETIQSILTFSPAIKTLHLLCVAFEESDDLVRNLLPAYPLLSSVHLQYVTFCRHSHACTDVDATPSLPKIKPLTVQIDKVVTDPTSSIALVFGRLHASIQLSIDTFEFVDYAMLENSATVSLSISRAKTFVTYLTTELESITLGNADTRGLHTFSMSTLHIDCSGQPTLKYEWLPKLLRLVPVSPHKLIRFNFGSHASDDIRFDVHDWLPLDLELVGLSDSMPQLSIVFYFDIIRIDGTDNGWLTELADLISERLPKLCERTARKSQVGVKCSTSTVVRDGEVVAGSLERWL